MSGRAAAEPVTAVLQRAEGWLSDGLAAVEARLAELAGSHGAELAAPARQTLSAGGKRMRPLLVLLSAGPDAGDRAVRAAVAVELVHKATLVHDDVLDGAPLRRGVPTVFISHGASRATATGDLLFSRAFAELAQPGSLDQVRTLATASAQLARGELAQRADAFDLQVGPERYLERSRLKTAALFECSCVIGRPPDDPARDALGSFGTEIGIAFQELDDVLDVIGPPERTGKARGTDLLDGTVNLPLIWAIEADPALGELDLRALDASSAASVCDRIEATGATARVRDDARLRVERAKETLADAELDPRSREAFELVADGVVERYG